MDYPCIQCVDDVPRTHFLRGKLFVGLKLKGAPTSITIVKFTSRICKSNQDESYSCQEVRKPQVKMVRLCCQGRLQYRITIAHSIKRDFKNLRVCRRASAPGINASMQETYKKENEWQTRLQCTTRAHTHTHIHTHTHTHTHKLRMFLVHARVVYGG